MTNTALILASGTGSRCELGYPKQFAIIGGKTILEYTIESFENHRSIDDIYVVTSGEYIETVNNIVSKAGYKKVKSVVKGGATRKDSSYNGISAIPHNEGNVLIHDGARPLVSEKIISDCITALQANAAVCTSIDSTDTVYITDESGFIKEIPKRKLIRRAQTPQCFWIDIIRKAHELAKNDTNCTVTDDCGLIQNYNLAKIKTIEGSPDNIKITYPKDIEFAKSILE